MIVVASKKKLNAILMGIIFIRIALDLMIDTSTHVFGCLTLGLLASIIMLLLSLVLVIPYLKQNNWKGLNYSSGFLFAGMLVLIYFYYTASPR